MQWVTEALGNSVNLIKFRERSIWVYVTSDWHWDSIKCNRDRLEQDLNVAKKINAPVICLGDVFDAMGGKYDPRSSKDEIRPELLHGNYFDEAVEQCADWLRPYANSIAIVTPGNHETAIRKRQETCLTTRLVERLKSFGSPVQQGGYAGWILVRGNPKPKRVATHRIWYHHGYGGGGPVTRGAIDFSRYLIDVDADTIAAGHIHQRMLIESTRQRVNAIGNVTVEPIYLVRSASYKDECLTDGWAVEKGMSSRPLGGWWLRLRWDRTHSRLIASYHDRPDANENA